MKPSEALVAYTKARHGNPPDSKTHAPVLEPGELYRNAAPLRPGADQHLQYPSRIGNTRRWPDGREECAPLT